MTYDLLIHNGTMVTMNAGSNILSNGIIGIRNGKIERIESFDPCTTLPEASEAVNAEGGLVMPGLVNTHTHLPMTLFRGLADDLPLMEWLNNHIFPAEAQHINPDSVFLGALLGCAEMLLSGTTTCCDGYFHEDTVAKAADRIGIRAVLAQGVIDFPAPGVPDPKKNIECAKDYTERWQAASPLISPSIFCHSPYTCSEGTLRRAKAAANESNVLFQIHLAETRNERDQLLSDQRLSPVKYLDRLGLLDERTLLIHAVWVDEEDIAVIADRKANISHNAGSNMKLAAGIAPISEFVQAGCTLGIGTDGCASNNTLDLFHEMNLVAKLHKAKTLDPTVLSAPCVLEMATRGGAKAVGLEQDVGSLEVGKAADIIILDTEKPHLTPMYNPISHLVYAATGADVRDVIVSGSIVVRNRRILTIDLDDVMLKVRHLAKQIKAK